MRAERTWPTKYAQHEQLLRERNLEKGSKDERELAASHDGAFLPIDLAILVDTRHELVVLLFRLDLVGEPLLEIGGEFVV